MNNMADIAHTLGCFFYYAPNDQKIIELIQLLNQPDNAEFSPLVEAWQYSNNAQLKNDFKQLFAGDDMPLPPWGSVYLDKERVLFGHSTHLYRLFLQQQGWQLHTQKCEPEDHIGLMLMAIAQLDLEENNEAIRQLLQDHLLPWSQYYLSQLTQVAESRFYQTLGNLTLAWLELLQDERAVIPTQCRIYPIGHPHK